MNIQSKIGLAALVLALSCGPMVAQEGPDEVAGGPGGEEMIGPGGPGGPGGEGFAEPDGPRGSLGPGRRQGEWSQRRGEFGLSRLLSDPEIQKKVGVTAEQVAKIRQQGSTFRKAEIRQRADLEVKRIDLRDLLSVDKPDRAAIDRQLQEISTSQLAMAKTRVDFRLNMKDALTPEQREKLKQAMRERWQSRGGQGQRGPGARGKRGPGAPGADGPGEAKPGE
ncbi:MAG: Spy/CpxP family protein refolding chaperone [Candidatus Acidiferrum sp.]